MEAFRRDYGAHRAAEGRGHQGGELLQLPYLRSGPLARQWRVRARTFDAFLRRVVRPMALSAGRPLRILDLGAGNGWLSHRLARQGHSCAAIDIRDDAVDGLGAAAPLLREVPFDCLIASFDDLPLPADSADLAVFNASLHYATDLAAVLAEAARVVRPGGTVSILDSPFYSRGSDGAAMVAEKHGTAHARFGDRAGTLLALPFIEYLTRERLDRASAALGLAWRRRRVRYPLWYELRPLLARLRRKRAPSRFDLWTAELP
jgi:SAM-dependent methyltransferase